MMKSFALFGTVITVPLAIFSQVTTTEVPTWERLSIIGLLCLCVTYLLREKHVMLKSLTVEVSKLAVEVRKLRDVTHYQTQIEEMKSGIVPRPNLDADD